MFKGMSKAQLGACFVVAVASVGYGLINIGGRMEGAHRAMWVEHHGEIAPGMVVRHKCDNPPCFRIDHLELGTRSDNMRDWVERGRFRGGWAS